MTITYVLLGLALGCAIVLPMAALGDPQRRCRAGRHHFDRIDFDTRVCVQCGHREVRQPCHPADCDPECPGDWQPLPHDDLGTFLSELYQVCGTLGASEKVLDQILAAQRGDPLPHATLLPYTDNPRAPGDE